ncbi:MAG TPA: hypothetical protein VFV52_11955 [Bacilli bacterium]|nr:hypothetical protein [Bacilli bacterium]
MPRQSKRDPQMVPFGYEPEKAEVKGTVIWMDAFAETTEEELREMLELADTRDFAQAVLFPHHEKTLRAIKVTDIPAFHKRVKNLQALLDAIDPLLPVEVDRWEEKRNKYTPMEASLRFLLDKYPAPHFLYLTDRFANAFASFASFDEWIRRVRLIIRITGPSEPHPKLLNYPNRWEALET